MNLGQALNGGRDTNPQVAIPDKANPATKSVEATGHTGGYPLPVGRTSPDSLSEPVIDTRSLPSRRKSGISVTDIYNDNATAYREFVVNSGGCVAIFQAIKLSRAFPDLTLAQGGAREVWDICFDDNINAPIQFDTLGAGLAGSIVIPDLVSKNTLDLTGTITGLTGLGTGTITNGLIGPTAGNQFKFTGVEALATLYAGGNTFLKIGGPDFHFQKIRLTPLSNVGVSMLRIITVENPCDLTVA